MEEKKVTMLNRELKKCCMENVEPCFACKETGYCKLLTDTKFEQTCPFYKTQAEYERGLLLYGDGLDYIMGHKRK